MHGADPNRISPFIFPMKELKEHEWHLAFMEGTRDDVA